MKKINRQKEKKEEKKLKRLKKSNGQIKNCEIEYREKLISEKNIILKKRKKKKDLMMY